MLIILKNFKRVYEHTIILHTIFTRKQFNLTSKKYDILSGNIFRIGYVIYFVSLCI